MIVTRTPLRVSLGGGELPLAACLPGNAERLAEGTADDRELRLALEPGGSSVIFRRRRGRS